MKQYDGDERIIIFIKDYMAKYGWSPSVREIANGTFYATSTVHEKLKILQDTKRIIYNGIRQIKVVK